MVTLPLLLVSAVSVRISTPPRVDGHLDDRVWTTIPASEAFTQSFPQDGQAPSDPTRVQVAYDDEDLYIAIDCVQRALTLQAYVQAVLATLRHRDPVLADPGDRVIALDDLRPGGFDAAMYDGREGALNATIVGRWEYRPGSTVFLVYSHAQVPSDEGTGFDTRALARGPAQDVVLIKLSWAWLK